MSEPAAPSRTVKVWDPAIRCFHWMLVASIAVAFLSAEEDSVLSPWHIPAGWVAAVLIVFRLVWGLIGGEHARFASFVRPSKIAGHLRDLFRGRLQPSLGHNPLGAIAVLALLVLVAATVATGVAGAEDGHEAIAFFLLGLITVHVGAVVVMSVLTRDSLIMAMITGRKQANRHPGAVNARPPTSVAAIAAVLVVGAVVFVAHQIDPQAFMPHAADEAPSSGPDGSIGENAPGAEDD